MLSLFVRVLEQNAAQKAPNDDKPPGLITEETIELIKQKAGLV